MINNINFAEVLVDFSIKDRMYVQRVLFLSREMEMKSKEEFDEYYNYIQDIVLQAQLDCRYKKVLFYMYFPFIKKISSTYMHKLKVIVGYDYFEYNDVFNICYIYFDFLTKTYDKSKSTFSYYIKYYLIAYMKGWYNKQKMEYFQNIHIQSISNSQFIDRELKSPNRFHSSVIASILYKDYKKYIFKLYEKKYRTTTPNIILKDYFMGTKTVQEIADDRKISYHAVYETINRIKKELADNFNKNKYCSYTIKRITGSIRTSEKIFNIQHRRLEKAARKNT